MSTPSINSATTPSWSANTPGASTAATPEGTTASAPVTAAGAAHAVRQQTNMQILQSSVDLSVKSGDRSQELVFRTAIEALNEVLAPTAGPNAIQNAMSQDNSAEATANRILKLSTGFFGAYAAQHPGEDPDKVASQFVDLIRGGFERGFKEASKILSGLGVLGGDIASGINKTYELVHKGLDDFLAANTRAGKDTAAAPTSAN